MNKEIKQMTADEILEIGENHKVVWNYYTATLRGYDGYNRLYLNTNTGEIFENYEASQNTWIEADNIAEICGTSALNGAELNEEELETLEDWCGEWYQEWINGFFLDALENTLKNID